MKAIRIASTVFIAILAFSQGAQADPAENAALLACDVQHNTFTIRFGRYSNSDPIEDADLVKTAADVMRVWPLTTPTVGGDCRLADGQEVRVSTITGQAFPYGQGGADPEAGVSVRIAGIDIYYRRVFYPGYGSEDYAIGAIIYRDGRLQECRARNEEDERTGAPPPECKDVSGRLSGNGLSAPERVALEMEQKRQQIAKDVNPACHALRSRRDSLPKDSYSEVGDFPSGQLAEYKVDINNDGNLDRVIRVGGGSSDCQGCGNHYFDGSLLVAFDGANANADKLVRFMQNPGDTLDLETLPKRKELADWEGHLVSLGAAGSSIRYVYNMPFVADGTTYIYSFETNSEQLPTAVISKLTAGYAAEAICKFSD